LILPNHTIYYVNIRNNFKYTGYSSHGSFILPEAGLTKTGQGMRKGFVFLNPY